MGTTLQVICCSNQEEKTMDQDTDIRASDIPNPLVHSHPTLNPDFNHSNFHRSLSTTTTIPNTN